MKRRYNPYGITWLEILLYGGVMLVCVIMAGCQPYMEMQAFNRHSKTKATYWDAMFSELRIIAD